MNQIGIYEQLLSELVSKNLDKQRFYIGEKPLETEEASLWLSRFLSHILQGAINSIPNSKNRLQEQIDLANKLILWLKKYLNDESLDENLIDTQGRILTSLFNRQNPIAADLSKYEQSIFPITGLSQSELFSGANAGISLESEIKREILSADKIYWLVSFIKWAGIRIFKDELKTFTQSGKPLKIITTSYMGATDAKAVEFLASLPNTEVKLSYNTQQERLHAKSYMFMRDTEFHTAYIGSSNLSHSALTSGLEWNLKITSQEIPHIIDKTIHTFETYWQSNDFEHFSGTAECKTRLRRALHGEQHRPNHSTTFFADISPYPHQKVILEKLQTEREIHQRYRNLVVAATGTGKTLISAFDFERYRQQNPNARFLFMAHREEILQQARAAYRAVLRDNTFGQLWVGQHQPEYHQQLFVSVQTLNSQWQNLNLTADYYNFIVIDEVHHVTASSYRQAIQHFSPNILLGLTATPERHDGGNILEDFGGVIAAEIRLPEAINQRHLCPFQYFAIDDGTDLSEVSWQNGRYQISELSKLYTQSDKRSAQIIQNLSEIVTDIQEIKALAFCVSQEHADYMAKKFLLKGINADVLTSKNSEHRNAKRQALSNGDINILCVVDIFNEGVDIPEIDTLLFLRPTESLTIFLQQLGRGLRLPSKYSTKEVCTVLDFVGNARPEYDFANKFRALLGKTKQPIDKEIEKGFPNLPLGCRIELQKQTQTTILKNIRQAVNSTQRLRRLIQQYSQHTNLPLTLKNFLHIYPNVQLEDIYKSSHKGIGGWNWLINQDISEQDKPLYKAYYRAINTQLLNCNSISYLRFLQKLCLNNFEVQLNTNPYSLIAYFNFWDKDSKTTKFQSIEQSLKALKHQKLQKELSEMLELLIAKVDHQELQLPSIVNHPIKVHSRYTREQILAGFGDSTFKRKSSAREGVVAINNSTTLLLFVTLDKCEKNYSPTTLYHDYAISPSLFHWQSQNASTPDSGRGLSYIEQKPNGTTIILFVREKNKDQYGRTMGFVNFGEVEYRKHHGSKPMNITWQLKQEMPNQLWHDAAKLALG